MPVKTKTYTKTFNACNFKMSLPLFEKKSGKVQISFNMKFNYGTTADVVLNNLIIKSSSGKKDIDVLYYCNAAQLESRVSFAFPYTGGLSGMRVYFEFIRADGKTHEIVYKIDNNKNSVFDGVYTNQVSKTIYEETKNRCAESREALHSSLLEYKNAVLREMYYLKEEGGRKFKVNNGEFISVIENMYSYGFDLETELSLAEDAPITLHLTMRTVNGTVLACEGFHLILLLETSIGKHIETAHLSADPWKLLQALHNRLDFLNSDHRIANRLIDNECHKNGSVSDIKMGQTTAIEISKQNPIEIIWGPPGTGKTYTMAQIAMEYLKQEKSILMVSHSNISVDGFVIELAEKIRQSEAKLNRNYLQEGRILRYGYVKSEKLQDDIEIVAYNYALSHDGFRKHRILTLLKEKDTLKDIKDPRNVEIDTELKKIRTELKKAEKQFAANAKLLATTISKVSIDSIFDEKKYDVVMFDEVSMAYVPQVIEAAMFAQEHFICVGDFRQLAPIAQSDAKKHLEKDIFSYLGVVDGVGNLRYHPWLVMLDEQRRMHPAISKFPSKRIYDDLLKDHISTKESRNNIVDLKPFQGEPITLIDLTGTYSLAGKNSDNSRYNILSATISFLTAVEAVRNGCNSVGIITPYAAQSRLIQAMIIDHGDGLNEMVTCSTVHQFQGSERDVIIFDGVESYPSEKPGWLMTRNDNESLLRLINVAVTRARGKLIVVADYKYWDDIFKGQGNIFYTLLRHIICNGNVVSGTGETFKNYINSIKKTNNIMKWLDYKSVKDNLYSNISASKNRIILSLADSLLIEDKTLFEKLNLQADYGVFVTGKTHDYKTLDKQWKSKIWSCEEKCFPLLMIDDTYMFYHVPETKGKMIYKDHQYFVSCNLFFKIKGHTTIEMIKSLTDIEYRYNNGLKMRMDSTPNNTSQPDNGNNMLSGLALFIYENKACPKCKNPLLLTKGRSGKSYLKCTNKGCDHTEILDYQIMNRYIKKNTITCPKDGGNLKAGVSYKGLYVRCSCGHFIDPTMI